MNSVLYLSGLAGALIAAVVLRCWDISADLPAYFARGSQDLTTDAAYLTLYAKTAVQFGSWNLFGFEPWSAFRVSLISGVSYLLFVLLGVSRVSAALAGALLQLVGLALFVDGCRRWLRRETVLVIAAVLASNYLLVLFGRVPFSEDGLIFFAGLAWWVFARWGDRAWGTVVVGLVLTCGALLGKSFGFLIAGGPALALLADKEQRRVRGLMLLIVPIAVLTAAYTVLLPAGKTFFDFLYAHGVIQHGKPYGFTSPIAFVESLVAVARTGLHYYTPALSVATYLAILAVLVGNIQLHRANRLFLFMVGWLVTWLVLLSPFNYQPVRYHFILTVPITIILGIVVERICESGFAVRRPWGLGRIAGLLMVNWYAVTTVYIALFVPAFTIDTLTRAVWRSFAAALLLTALLYFVIRPVKRRFAGTTSMVLPLAIVAVVFLTDFWQFFSWFPRRTHMVDDACRDIGQLLGPSALFGGQLGPLLASDSRLRGFPMFLSDDVSKDLPTFRAYPITHVAIGKSDYQKHVTSGDILGRAPVVATLWMRDTYVRVLRISGLTGNPQAQQYTPTAYENACAWRDSGRYAEAEAAISQVLSQHPHNKMALIEKYYLVLATSNLPAAQPVVDTLYTYYHDDYTVSLLAAIYYKYLAQQPGYPAASAKSRKYYQEALWRGYTESKAVQLMYEGFEPSTRVIK